jgi:hypothetical protein
MGKGETETATARETAPELDMPEEEREAPSKTIGKQRTQTE